MEETAVQPAERTGAVLAAWEEKALGKSECREFIAGELDQVDFRGLFQLRPFCDICSPLFPCFSAICSDKC